MVDTTSMKPIQIENAASGATQEGLLGTNKFSIPASESATLTPVIAQSKAQEGELSSTPRDAPKPGTATKEQASS